MESFFDYLKVILILCGFLYVTYLTTKFVAKKQNKAFTGKHINVTETVFLGKDRYLHLVKAGNQFLLIASTPKGVELLTTVDIDSSLQENEQDPPQAVQTFDFKALLDKYSSTLKTRKVNSSAKVKEENDQKGIFEVMQPAPEGKMFRRNLEKIRKMSQRTQK